MNGISDPVVSWRAIWLARQAFRSSRLVEISFRPIANFENYWRTRSKYATSFLRTCSEFGNRVLWLAVISNSQSKLIEMRFDWLIFLQPIITRILKISLYFITSRMRFSYRPNPFLWSPYDLIVRSDDDRRKYCPMWNAHKILPLSLAIYRSIPRHIRVVESNVEIYV